MECDLEGQARRSINRRGQADTLVYDALHRLRSRRGGPSIADTVAYSADERVVTTANAASSVSAYLNATTRAVDSTITVLTIPGVGTRTYKRRAAYRANAYLDSVYTTGPSGSNFLNRRFGYHATRLSLDSLRFGTGWTVIKRGKDGQQESVHFPTTSDSIYTAVLPAHDISRLRSSLVGGLDDFYHYDDAGRLDQMDRLGSNVRLFGYDSLGRLGAIALTARVDSACVGAGDDGYSCYVAYDSVRINTFDRAGNRTATDAYPWSGSPLWGVTGSYGTGNRITDFAGCSYTTDSDGNVTGRSCAGETLDLYWSQDGRLDSLKRNNVKTAFAYDPAGHVVRRDSAGSTVANFLWDGDNLLAELGPGGDSTRSEYSYYPGLDNLHAFAYRTSGQWTTGYAHRDQLGNIRGIADGVYQYRLYDYDEWGNDLGTTGGSPSPGQLDRARWKGALLMAPEAELYYMRSRWYEPRTGRFLSEDPLGLAAGINPYAFAGADPIGGADPSGLGPCRLIDMINELCFPPLDPIEVTAPWSVPRSPYDVRNGGCDQIDWERGGRSDCMWTRDDGGRGYPSTQDPPVATELARPAGMCKRLVVAAAAGLVGDALGLGALDAVRALRGGLLAGTRAGRMAAAAGRAARAGDGAWSIMAQVAGRQAAIRVVAQRRGAAAAFYGLASEVAGPDAPVWYTAATMIPWVGSGVQGIVAGAVCAHENGLF